MSEIHVFVNGHRAILLVGGPEYVIQVNGKRYRFEDHKWCGPTILNKRGDPIDLQKHPKEFFEAVTFWAQQGRRVEGGLCRWDRTFEPEPIMKHLGGRHWEVVGHHPAKPPVRGE